MDSMALGDEHWLFLIPLTIVAAYTLAAFCDRLGLSVAFARRLSVYALAVGLSTVMAACVLSLRDMKSLGFITGTISRRQFMLAIPYYRPIDFINRQLPANARIMIFDTQMNYDLHRDYISDETWFATKWRRLLIHRGSLEEVNEELKRQGFTHVLFSPDLFTYAAIIGVEGSGMDFNSGKRVPLSEEARRLGPEYPLLRNWATFTLYRTKFLEPIYTDENDYEVLRIK